MSSHHSVVVSRDGRRPSSSARSVASRGAGQQQRPPQQQPLVSIGCNRCRKPLSTNVYVCACDCVFCEECTFNHFNNSSNCPLCGRMLRESDFAELVIADSSALDNQQSGSTIDTVSRQQIFTRASSASSTNGQLTYQDMMLRQMQQLDHVRGSIKFLLKQTLVHTNHTTLQLVQCRQAMQTLQAQHTSVVQGANSYKMKMDHTVTDLQQKLSGMQKKLDEKDRQLQQFRKLHQGMTPPSPASGGLNDPHHRPHGRGGGRQSTPPIIPHHQAAPPLQGFMKQKEASERAKQRALEQARQRPVVLGQNQQHQQRPISTQPRSSSGSSVVYGSGSGNNSGGARGRPYSTGSNGSSGGGGYQFSSNKRPRPSSTLPSPTLGYGSQSQPSSSSGSGSYYHHNPYSSNSTQHRRRR